MIVPSTFKKLFNNTFYDTLNSFSKVTNYVMSGMGQLDLQERRPERRRDNNDDEFEFLNSEEVLILITIKRF